MIKLQVIGNLGKDAQVNNVNGKTVINFNVAHTERYKDAQGNQKDRTTWVDCSYWTDRTAVASVQLLGAKPSGGSSDGAAPSNYTPTAAPNAADESMDDLPF